VREGQIGTAEVLARARALAVADGAVFHARGMSEHGGTALDLAGNEDMGFGAVYRR